MLPTDKLAIAGEHAFFFSGAVGQMEAVLTVPQVLCDGTVAVLGHPHSLQGGSMTNKVVTSMARAFRDLGIPSLRFNFRGVGNSAGAYDAGVGESEDMMMLIDLWTRQHPDCRVLLAGFSFGSYVVFRAARLCHPEILITVAPPVHHYDYQDYSILPENWTIFQGDEDEVVPAQLVFDFAAATNPPLPVIRFADTGHFFHGQLMPLREALMSLVNRQVLCP